MERDGKNGFFARGIAELQKRERLLETALLYLLFAGLGALLGGTELVFGIRPFGVALSAAAGTILPAVALGVALFALITSDYLSIAALGILLLCRLGASLLPDADGKRPALLDERVGLRVLSAALAIFSTALFALLRSDFRYYYLFGLILGTLTAALAAFLLTGLFMPKDKLFPLSREAGGAALFLLAVFAMREVAFFGIYPSAVAAAMVAFYLAAHYGFAGGAIGGGLCGLCFNVPFAPAFLLCGLGFGLLEKSSRGGGILTGGGLGALYAFLLLGTDGIGTLLPSLLTAGALFLAVDSAGLVVGAPAYRAGTLRRRGAAQSALALRAEWAETRLRSISGAFSDLSGILYELSGRQRRPGLLDLRQLCDREFDRVCPQCTHRDICWGSEYSATADAVGKLCNRLYATGTVDRTKLPDALVARCRALPTILEGINNGAQYLCEEALRGDKTSVVAMDYAALGRVLGEAVETGRDAYEIDAACGERIFAALARRGYSLESVCVCGKTHRKVQLRGVRLSGRRVPLRELRGILEAQCGFLLGEAECREHEGVQDILFCERAQLRCATVKQTRAKSREDGSYCGDSVMSFSAGGYAYAFLCDGMGSGNAAALTSALAATVLSGFLRAGNRADTSLRMLNGVLAARGRRESESSTTVDLLEIDCVKKEATLFKCGAAPTYLLRRGETTRFFSRTAPAGILETLDAERLRFSLEAGDVLVQVSDGVTGGEEECRWLSELLLTRWEGDADAFARLVLNRASADGKDDLSVLITEVLPASAPGAAEMAS